MPREPISAFLEAEQEAERLVNVLKRLQDEVESYQTARSALTDVSAKLAKASDTMQNTATGLANVVQTLRTIGTPELLQAQQEVSARVVGLEQRLAEATSIMSRLPEEIRQLAETVRQEQAAFQESLSTRFEQSLQDFRRTVVILGVVIMVAQAVMAIGVFLGP